MHSQTWMNSKVEVQIKDVSVLPSLKGGQKQTLGYTLLHLTTPFVRASKLRDAIEFAFKLFCFVLLLS